MKKVTGNFFMKRGFLFYSEKGCDPYVKLKNNEKCRKYREKLEERYIICHNVLDKDFLIKFPNETSSRVLELHVAYALLKNARRLVLKTSNGCTKKDQGGPDFKIDTENNRIFIECVYANNSEKENVDAECEIEDDPPFHMQTGIDKIKVSRITSVIRDKAKKIQKYKEKGIIKDNDIVILVVGSNFVCGDFEFEAVIAAKKNFAWVSPGKTEIVAEDNKDGEFKKNGECIRLKQEDLDQFNVIIHANYYWEMEDSQNKEKVDNIVNFHAYERRLPDTNSERIIEELFNTKLKKAEGAYMFYTEALKPSTQK